jgi:class 3 adenylate cyclase
MSLARDARMEMNLTRDVLQLEALAGSWLTTLSRQLGSIARNTWSDVLRARERVTPKPAQLALLITDLVDFSTLLESLGDDAAHSLIHEHNRLLRACLRAHGGREVTHTGDGIMAAFTSATAAIGCGIRMQERLCLLRAKRPLARLHARVGLHAGRPLPEEGRLFGTPVIEAVRICSLAPADSILVSDAIRDWAGHGYAYEDRGTFQLKGFREPRRLHAVTWGSSC